MKLLEKSFSFHKLFFPNSLFLFFVMENKTEKKKNGIFRIGYGLDGFLD